MPVIRRRDFVRLAGAAVLGATGCDTAVRTPRVAGLTRTDPLSMVTAEQGDRITLSGGDHVVLRSAARRIECFAPDGGLRWVLSGDDVSAVPSPIAIAPYGEALVALDWTGGRVVVVGSDGIVTEVWDGIPRFEAPRGLAVVGNDVVVTDGARHEVFVTSASERRTVIAAGIDLLNGPRGVAVGPDGEIHVVDGGNARVVVLTRDGTVVDEYGGGQGMISPRSVAVRPDGVSVVADAMAGTVFAFDRGTLLSTWRPDRPEDAPFGARFDRDGSVRVALRGI